MLDSVLEQRKIPDIFANVANACEWEEKRQELKKLLLEEEYGKFPPKPERVEFFEEIIRKDFAAGRADLKKIIISTYWDNKSFSFPIYSTVPKSEGRHPAFIHINFRPNVPDMYMNNEEILENGFAVFSFDYNDVTSDSDDFTNKLAGVLFEGKERSDTDCGKIAMWSWAASRVIDYAYTLDSIDKEKLCVCGHSRLGKTALLTGAFDDRVCLTVSNDSGSSGAALARGKSGEKIDNICRTFPYWFCKNYNKYRNNEETLPFDQHALIAIAAPRYVCIGSAIEDTWADPKSEQLAAYAASRAWELYGGKGLVCDDRFANSDERFHLGSVGYHMRSGKHYFSRTDWLCYMDFFKSKICGK